MTKFQFTNSVQFGFEHECYLRKNKKKLVDNLRNRCQCTGVEPVIECVCAWGRMAGAMFRCSMLVARFITSMDFYYYSGYIMNFELIKVPQFNHGEKAWERGYPFHTLHLAYDLNLLGLIWPFHTLYLTYNLKFLSLIWTF